jgi:hypothetical protein
VRTLCRQMIRLLVEEKHSINHHFPYRDLKGNADYLFDLLKVKLTRRQEVQLGCMAAWTPVKDSHGQKLVRFAVGIVVNVKLQPKAKKNCSRWESNPRLHRHPLGGPRLLKAMGPPKG